MAIKQSEELPRMGKSMTNPANLNSQLLAAIQENSDEGIVVSDPNNIILSVNRAFTVITGFQPKEIIGKSGSFLRSWMQDESFYTHLWRTVKTQGRWEGEMWVRKQSGEIFPEWLVFKAVKDENGETLLYLTIFSDISERKTTNERIEFLDNYDPLTNLPNRSKLLNHLELDLANAKNNNTKIALLIIGLDRFKNINTSLGFNIGDLLLVAVANRLKTLLGEQNILARLGGDEFAIVVSDIKTFAYAGHLSEKILTSLREHFFINDESLNCTASIGISIYPNDGETVQTLLKNAETALYRAKQTNRGSYQFFIPAMSANITERLRLENELYYALDREELELYYQPLIKLKTNKIYGAEVLIRWHHKDQGLIEPNTFIPIAEESGLIIPITEWILKKACQQNHEWVTAGLPKIC